MVSIGNIDMKEKGKKFGTLSGNFSDNFFESKQSELEN